MGLLDEYKHFVMLWQFRCAIPDFCYDLIPFWYVGHKGNLLGKEFIKLVRGCVAAAFPLK